MSVLAVDLGGTGLRAALVGPEGDLGPIAVEPGVGDTGEVDPETWWAALESALAQLAQGADFGTAKAVAITGFTRTQVFLDAGGRPVRPAITWRDARAGALAAAEGLDHPEGAQLNAFHPVGRLMWLQAHEPEVLARVATVLEPKDFLNHRLTGRAVTDPVSSARLLAAARPHEGRSLIEALGLPMHLVPEALAPGEGIAAVRPDLPPPFDRLAGRPVVAVGNDTWAAVLGLGALRDGFGYNISGTTEVFGTVWDRPAAAPGLLSVDWGPGLHQLGGPSQNGGDTLVWGLGLLGRSDPVGPALDALLAAPRDRQPLLFLPYLQGERTPHWNPDLRGAFLGLNRRHGAADAAVAILEGIAFLNRTVLERAEAALGRRVAEIRIGGGGAGNAAWRQIKADVCERPVVATACPEPGLLGCALAARSALGDFPTLAAAQAALARPAARHEPDPDRRERYRRLFALFGRAEEALAPLSAALARFPEG